MIELSVAALVQRILMAWIELQRLLARVVAVPPSASAQRELAFDWQRGRPLRRLREFLHTRPHVDAAELEFVWRAE